MVLSEFPWRTRTLTASPGAAADPHRLRLQQDVDAFVAHQFFDGSSKIIIFSFEQLLRTLNDRHSTPEAAHCLSDSNPTYPLPAQSDVPGGAGALTPRHASWDWPPRGPGRRESASREPSPKNTRSLRKRCAFRRPST